MPSIQPLPNQATIAALRFVLRFALRFAVVCAAFWVGCGLFCPMANAQWFKGFRRQAAPAIPTAFTGMPTQQQLLQRLAAQTAMVRQVDASVTVAIPGAPKLRGTIQIERPLRLRLKAGVLGVDQMGVDVGSNDELFWIWTRAAIGGQAPTLMYAFHEQFKRSTGSVRQAIPLEPNWLINALGLVEFSKDDFHEGPLLTPQGRLKLITVSNADAGRQYRITLIDATRGLIEQQSIYDENRNLIAYTNSTGYKFYPQHNVSLPNEIEMHLYTSDGHEQELTVTTNGFNINSLFGDPQRMWTMPQPSNVQKIDLSQVGGQPQPRTPQPPTSLPSTTAPSSTVPPYPAFPTPQPSYRSTPARPASTSTAPRLQPSPTNGNWHPPSQPSSAASSQSAPQLRPPESRTRLSPLR